MKVMEFQRTVELVLIQEDESGDQRVLMSERGPGKHGADKTALPGGHWNYLEEAGRWEMNCETAEREAREELGGELAEIVRAAFEAGTVTIAAGVDDFRDEAGILYNHTALKIMIPPGINPDPHAPDANEHMNLGWRSVQALGTIAVEQFYPPHYQAIAALMAGDHRYAHVEGLQ